MTSMTIKAAKSAPDPALPSTPAPSPPPSISLTLVSPLWAVIFSFLFFALFCFLLRFHFLVVCQKFIDLSLVWLWHCSRGEKGERGGVGKGCQKPTSCLYYRQNSAAAPTTFAFFIRSLLNLRAQYQKSCQTFQGQCQKIKRSRIQIQ